MVELRITDMEPVRSLLDAMARAALPEAARSGISILLGAAQDFMTHN
jgi:hypothetical protein